MKNCYWQPDAVTPNGQAPLHATYDALILGGGYAGMSSARFLKQRDPSLRIAILEKDYVGFGASGRNGGFAMTLLGLNNAQLLHDAGQEKARAAHQFMKDAVQHVRDLVTDHGIECEMVDKGFMGIALNKAHDKKIRHEVECFQKLGTDARYLDKKAISEILPDSSVIESGLWEPNAVVLHPFKLARGLKKVTEDLGVEVCEGQAAQSFRKTANGYEVTLPSGATVNCKKLIITTNAYAYNLGLFKNAIAPIYTYIVATEPLTPKQWETIGWKDRNGIESVFRLVHYMRPTKDGRILLGGKSAYYYFGHQTRPEFDEHEGLFNALRADVTKLFPSLKGIRFSHAWGGPIGSTLNFFPTVGHTTKDPDLIWALGCCGHGVSTFNYVGKIVADLFHNTKSKETEVFFVNKKPWALLPPEPLKYLGAGGYKNALWVMDRIDEVRSGKFF